MRIRNNVTSIRGSRLAGIAALVLACFLAPAAVAVAATPPANLTVNPSFEKDTSGWRATSGLLTRQENTAATDGAYTARVKAGPGRTYGIVADSATVRSAPQRATYIAEADIAKGASSTLGDLVQLRLRETTASGAVVQESISRSQGMGTAFKHFSVSITPAVGNSVSISIHSIRGVSVTDALLIDRVILTRSDSATATPPVSTPTPTTSPTPTTTPHAPTPTTAPAPASTPTTTPAPAPTPATTPTASIGYPAHTNIVSTTFWVGEIFNANLSDGSQVCSTYDAQWAASHTGISRWPSTDTGCNGSPVGGCDGVSSGTSYGTFRCVTERRTAANDYFPTAQPAPLQNPFYLDLPYDDLNDSNAFAERCSVIPWAVADNAASGVNNCANQNYSYMKNRWVQITGPNGKTCYGQIEDAGPSSGSLYHDKNYVFGAGDARPRNTQFSGDPTQGAGMDVSPALNGCLGFADLDGDRDHVRWNFVDKRDVPAGPWTRVITTAQVRN